MCGRFSLTANLTTVAQRFGVPIPTAESAAWTPHYNIAPTKTVVVVGDDGTRYLTEMRWGLIPSWAKDPAIGNRMINARAETVATKPAFRVAFHAEDVTAPSEIIPALGRAFDENAKGQPAFLELICSHHPIHGGWVRQRRRASSAGAVTQSD